jgi:hypothetical protein
MVSTLDTTSKTFKAAAGAEIHSDDPRGYGRVGGMVSVPQAAIVGLFNRELPNMRVGAGADAFELDTKNVPPHITSWAYDEASKRLDDRAEIATEAYRLMSEYLKNPEIARMIPVQPTAPAAPAPAPAVVPTPQPVPQPVPQALQQPVPQPVPQQIQQPVPQPAPLPPPQPVPQPAPQPAVVYQQPAAPPVDDGRLIRIEETLAYLVQRMQDVQPSTPKEVVPADKVPMPEEVQKDNKPPPEVEYDSSPPAGTLELAAVEGALDSLKIPDLGQEANKPEFCVEFDLGEAGIHEAWYHWVVEHNGGLFLIYDNRFEYGSKYKPPNLGEARPIKVSLRTPDGPRSFSVFSMNFTLPFGVFDIINLVIAQDGSHGEER